MRDRLKIIILLIFVFAGVAGAIFVAVSPTFREVNQQLQELPGK